MGRCAITETGRRSPFPLTMPSPGLNREWACLALETVFYHFSNNIEETNGTDLALHSLLINLGGSVICWKEQQFGDNRPGFQPWFCIYFYVGDLPECLYLSLLAKWCGYRPQETVRVNYMKAHCLIVQFSSTFMVPAHRLARTGDSEFTEYIISLSPVS